MVLGSKWEAAPNVLQCLLLNDKHEKATMPANAQSRGMKFAMGGCDSTVVLGNNC